MGSGFSYRVFSRAGESMSDGFLVPARHDGMATFPGPDGMTILVRNHEITPGADAEQGPFGSDLALLDRVDPSRLCGEFTDTWGGSAYFFPAALLTAAFAGPDALWVVPLFTGLGATLGYEARSIPREKAIESKGSRGPTAHLVPMVGSDRGALVVMSWRI